MSPAAVKHGIGERFSSPDKSQSYGEHLLYHKHAYAYQEIQSMVAGKDALEIGCGTAYGTVDLANVAKSLVALDIDPVLIENLRVQYGNCKIRFQCYDGYAMPMGDACVDSLLAFQVLEHVQDDRRFLMEIKRVLRKDGMAVLTTPNRLLRLVKNQKPFNNYHTREYSAAELEALARSLGFRVSIEGIFGDPVTQAFEIQRVKKYHTWYFRTLFQGLPRGLQMYVKNLTLRVSRFLSRGTKESPLHPFKFHRSRQSIDQALDLWLELRLE